jgi:HK97 family phage prohead protease
MKQRHVRFEVKTLADDGSFEGLLSPYNNVDEGGDCVDAGAFKKTLAENGSSVPMLWQHKSDCPIGELQLEDRSNGLWCKGQLLLDIPEAKKAYLLLKAKIIKGLSIGYDAIQATVVNGVRHLKEIKLYEGSVVTFPMNTMAMVTAVKAANATSDFNTELAGIQLCAAHYQYLNALQLALDEIRWSTLSPDDGIAAFNVILDQFADAYRDYLTAYLTPDTKGHRPSEVKEGRRLSSASKESIKQAHKCVKDATDILLSLLGDEADVDSDDDSDDDDTSKSAAVSETKSKPEDSTLAAQLAAMRALLA